MKKKFRIVSLIMLVLAILYIIFVLPRPGCGFVVYFGSFAFNEEAQHITYAVYLVIMVGLFAASFFVDGKKKNNK